MVTSAPNEAFLRERALGLVGRLLADRIDADSALVSVEADGDRLDHVRVGRGLEALLRDDARFVRGVMHSGTALVERTPPRDAFGGLACVVAAPIQVPTAVAGALCVGFSEPPVASEATLTWTVETHCALAGLCLGDPEGARRLMDAAETDELTGCLKQSSLTQVLGEQINRSSRSGQPLACCLVGFDEFELVDVLLGQPAGDQVLGLAGRTLSRAVRSYDVVTRYGNAEFAVVLPETGIEAALDLARRLKRALEQHTDSPLGGYLTTSVGVAEWLPGWSADDLVQAAAAATPGVLTGRRPRP